MCASGVWHWGGGAAGQAERFLHSDQRSGQTGHADLVCDNNVQCSASTPTPPPHHKIHSNDLYVSTHKHKGTWHEIHTHLHLTVSIVTGNQQTWPGNDYFLHWYHQLIHKEDGYHVFTRQKLGLFLLHCKGLLFIQTFLWHCEQTLFVWKCISARCFFIHSFCLCVY